jgi:hypothetical protein
MEPGDCEVVPTIVADSGGALEEKSRGRSEHVD